MFTSPIAASPFRVTAATPTVAQSCERLRNLRNDQPAPSSAGTRTSVSMSAGPSAVSKTPRKNSAAATFRPSWKTSSASSAISTAG